MAAIESSYASWTFAANGAGMPEDEKAPDAPKEWNAAFFSVVAVNLRGKSFDEIEPVLRPLFSLSDERFFDLTETVLYMIDALCFDEKALEPEVVLEVRKSFAERLTKSFGFRQLRSSRSQHWPS